MIEILGWICTGLVLLGFWFNANKNHIYALVFWIIGDLGWITYDYFINNWSHATLSTTIILINIFGIFKWKKSN